MSTSWSIVLSPKKKYSSFLIQFNDDVSNYYVIFVLLSDPELSDSRLARGLKVLLLLLLL